MTTNTIKPAYKGGRRAERPALFRRVVVHFPELPRSSSDLIKTQRCRGMIATFAEVKERRPWSPIDTFSGVNGTLFFARLVRRHWLLSQERFCFLFFVLAYRNVYITGTAFVRSAFCFSSAFYLLLPVDLFICIITTLIKPISWKFYTNKFEYLIRKTLLRNKHNTIYLCSKKYK